MSLNQTNIPESNLELKSTEPISETLVDPMNRRSAPLTSSNQGFLPVLKNPRFLILWSGQIFSQLADKFYLVLMIALIDNHYKATDQSISAWVSAIMISNTIPAILFGSFAGVYVDRWSKKSVLVISNFVRGFLVLVLPILLWVFQEQTLGLPLHWLPSFLRHWNSSDQEVFNLPLGFLILLIATFLVSTLTQFFAPAEQSALPLIVKRRHLLAANSLNTTTMMAVLIIGFAIGQPLLVLADRLVGSGDTGGDLGKIIVVGGSYIISAFILLLLRTSEKTLKLNQESPHVLQDIADGLRYLRENQKVRNALIQLVILFCIFAALSVLAVRLAETIPGMKAEQFGWLLAAGGVGMAISAVGLGYWGQQFSHTQLGLWGALGMGFSLIALSFSSHSLPAALLTTALLGVFAALVGVPMQTTIQVETPPAMRGKVFGLQNNVDNIALSLPLALAGIAETVFGLKPVLLSLAVLAIAGGILTWLMARENR
jgi:predicted MFS family arabinose efflux permease